MPCLTPALGCRYSSENKDWDQDREERKLLLDPSSPPAQALDGAEPSSHSLPSAHTDEQAPLSSVPANTAGNVTEPAEGSQGLPRRTAAPAHGAGRQFSAHLAVLSSSLTRGKTQLPLSSHTSQPHRVPAGEPNPSPTYSCWFVTRVQMSLNLNELSLSF
ncbi:ragulator complex protein LAMTOR1-like [Panthera leo]|uniref:ragulator complex protein LAMTOR1-like n=1 Tax=Panthera leo TaxID=9689 RepID=UPI001C696E60|nr:ragulator complex protein LAMTOR1-like [Panthera leo]